MEKYGSSACVRQISGKRNFMQNTIKTRDGRSLLAPSAEEDEAITRAAQSDPDAQPLTEDQLANLKPVRYRGRPVGSGSKVQLTVRFDIDIVNHFKRSGEGWQTRMNDALREWVAAH
jgi:uncharacterized protein (DUF4415 family)